MTFIQNYLQHLIGQNEMFLEFLLTTTYIVELLISYGIASVSSWGSIEIAVFTEK